jgi:hypothetical protein
MRAAASDMEQAHVEKYHELLWIIHLSRIWNDCKVMEAWTARLLRNRWFLVIYNSLAATDFMLLASQVYLRTKHALDLCYCELHFMINIREYYTRSNWTRYTTPWTQIELQYKDNLIFLNYNTGYYATVNSNWTDCKKLTPYMPLWTQI